jgi:N-acyl-D-amino-acid deacylase
VLFAILGILFQAQAAQPDILIRNGVIVDGSGNPWYYSDLAIKGDTIVAIGHLEGLTAPLIIDAKRMVVAPGFIDIHTHARRGIFQDPVAQNYIRQGVTTLMEGNDGSSPLPLAPFLERLTKTPLGVNFGTFAGQGSIRQQVIGLENRNATLEEIAKCER